MLANDYTPFIGTEANAIEPTQMMKETFKIELELLRLQLYNDMEALEKDLTESKRKACGPQTRSRSKQNAKAKSSC